MFQPIGISNRPCQTEILVLTEHASFVVHSLHANPSFLCQFKGLDNKESPFMFVFQILYNCTNSVLVKRFCLDVVSSVCLCVIGMFCQCVDTKYEPHEHEDCSVIGLETDMAIVEA